MRAGTKVQLARSELLRQLVYRRWRANERASDAEHFLRMQLSAGRPEKIWSGAALTSRSQSYEREVLKDKEEFA